MTHGIFKIALTLSGSEQAAVAKRLSWRYTGQRFRKTEHSEDGRTLP